MSASASEQSKEQQSSRVAKAEMSTTVPAEAVWAAWTDPEKLAQWFVDGARGVAQPGETMTWIWDAFGLEAKYDVVEAQPPHRLVLATPQQVAPAGLIEITISSRGGETVVTVVNSGFLDRGALEDSALVYQEGSDWDDVFEGIRSGWQLALGLLKEYLEYHNGESKQSFIHIRPAKFDFDDMLAWFTEEEKLARWLTRSGAPELVGGDFDLVLQDGTRLRGRTTVVTNREIAFALPRERALLELKSFATGPGASVIAIRGTFWSPQAERFKWLERVCDEALLRLVGAL